VMSVVEQEMQTPGYMDQILWQGRQIGDCYFWVIRPNPDDEYTPAYGLMDEGGKIDINYTPEEMLEYLPGLEMYPSIAAAIVDWRDMDDEVTVNENTGAEGAESNYYQSNLGYYAKNNPFESLDELRLVAGMTDLKEAEYYLWGADKNHNYTIEQSELSSSDTGMNFLTTMRGMMPYVTVYGYQATNPPAVTAVTDSLGNVNTATTTQPTALEEITYYTPLDINAPANSQGNDSMLYQLLSQYVSGNVQAIITATQNRLPQATNSGNQNQNQNQNTTTTTRSNFTSIFDWIATVNADADNITSQDLSVVTSDGTPLFNLLACVVPPATATTQPATQPATQSSTTQSSTPTQTKFAKLNVNTALLPALYCVFVQAEYLAGINADAESAAYEDAQYVISSRQQYSSSDPLQKSNISWLMDLLDPEVLRQAGPYLTGSSTVYSADIVTVSGDGRAFKRVKIVVDASAMLAAQVADANSYLSGATETGMDASTAIMTGPVIVYRRDLTDSGWPMDPEIRRALRRGEQLSQATSNVGAAATSDSLTFGP
jgi:hypothetical protein